MPTPSLPDDPARWQAVKACFEEALALPAPARAAFLEAACRTPDGRPDDALRAAVEALLDADTEADDFLDETASPFAPLLSALSASLTATAAAAGTAAPAAGQRIGPYRVAGPLGAGGMGEVFLAERADGVFAQTVALKLVKRGMDTDAVLRRFETERAILARLDHPGIARVLDGGATDDGRPWFAMEHVEGVPITAYVAQHTLGLGARLDLFEQVVEAVRHAHARLVVHRDLKPSNVLVTEDERGQPQVKLLDFGIARLLDGDDAGEASALTAAGVRPMTRPYAAPEQVRGEAVTTATDVYALGVLLYELLTGRRPFEAASTAALEEAILTREPARPSTALRAAAMGDRAAYRHLRGDLDTLVLKALRKAPEARYASADALLDDLRRHRAGLPLAARPPTIGYRVRLFARRHPTGVAVTAAVGLLLLAGGALYTTRVTAERDRAQEAAARAGATAAFLATLFENADPTVSQGDTLTAFDLLERGLGRIGTDLADAPLVQADLLDVMSRAYLRLGDAAHASALAARGVALRRAHPDPEDPAGPAPSLLRLAEAEGSLNHFARADSLYREAVALQRAHGGAPALIDALQARGWFLTSSNYNIEAIGPIYDEVLALRLATYGPDDPGRGLALYQLASAQHLLGHYARADSLYRLAIASFRRHAQNPAELADALYVLGTALFYLDRYAASDSMLTEALTLHQQMYGTEHAATADVLGALANTRRMLGREDEAEVLLDSALAVFSRIEGPEGPGAVRTLSGLRQLYTQEGRVDEALAVAERVVTAANALYRDDPARRSAFAAHYSVALANVGRYAEAEAYLRREVLPLMAETYGTTSAMYGIHTGDLARDVAAQGRTEEAERLFGEAYAVLAMSLPAGNDERGLVAAALGDLRAARGDHAAALPLLQEGVAAIHPGLPPETAARRRFRLGVSLCAVARYEEGARRLTEAHAQLEALLGRDHADTRAAADALDQCRRRLNRTR